MRDCSIRLRSRTRWHCATRSGRGGGWWFRPPHEAEAAEPPVFKMTVPRILQAGLFNFSVIWLAVIVGTMQYFDDLLPWSIDDVEDWIGVHQQEIWGLVSPVTIVLALGLFMVLGTVAGVIQMFVRNYGFTLSLEGRTLRRVRGLLTRSEVAIPLRRIQAARTAAHWLTRRYGLCRVDVQTMAGASSGGVQELAPLANAGEAAHVLAIAGGFERIAPERFAPVAPVHRWYDAQTRGPAAGAHRAGRWILSHRRSGGGWCSLDCSGPCR